MSVFIACGWNWISVTSKQSISRDICTVFFECQACSHPSCERKPSDFPSGAYNGRQRRGVCRGLHRLSRNAEVGNCSLHTFGSWNHVWECRGTYGRGFAVLDTVPPPGRRENCPVFQPRCSSGTSWWKGYVLFMKNRFFIWRKWTSAQFSFKIWAGFDEDC